MNFFKTSVNMDAIFESYGRVLIGPLFFTLKKSANHNQDSYHTPELVLAVNLFSGTGWLRSAGQTPLDPRALGFVWTLVLVGKQILQDLFRENIDWDEPISDHVRPRWEQWRNELCLLESLEITKCYRPDDFGKIKRVELHNVSDASQVGYGRSLQLSPPSKWANE